MRRPLGWDLAAGKVTIAGDGKAPISFTTRTDIAHFVGHVLTTLPAERLANSIFRIEGDRAVSFLSYSPKHSRPAHELASAVVERRYRGVPNKVREDAQRHVSPSSRARGFPEGEPSRLPLVPATQVGFGQRYRGQTRGASQWLVARVATEKGSGCVGLVGNQFCSA